MAVPKKKTSKSRRNMRRAHDRLEAVAVTECRNCGEAKLPHHVCPHCGYYAGRLVMAEKAGDETRG
jgi:large subunit ribosomal protein L32